MIRPKRSPRDAQGQEIETAGDHYNMIPEDEDFFDLIDGTVLQNGLQIQNYVGSLEMNRRTQLWIKQ